MSYPKSIVVAFVLMLSCCLFVPSLHAQTGGTATGRVFDQTAATIPGVTVELLPRGLRTTRSTLTGEDGVYRFGSVPEGPAELTFRLINFSTVRRTITAA